MEKKSVGLLELETAVLECFLEKTPLSPLGVKLLRLLPVQCGFRCPPTAVIRGCSNGGVARSMS
jgi:hypothetical protein